ncbi:MAG TPA: MarR family transcriptional regulator [Thermosulfurimonas dismutans]|uniref:MarR family transcriptional regulator n=1 Tax=Thermosulfurimonas dismutans TaxID=999894 RepID=A0A7C3CH72_9BACT|nr:hypothetical protein [Thermosulfurimonas sp.]HFC98590.1 MarR family transcriptional regulator [Thermosulfurimonas dismutans]
MLERPKGALERYREEMKYHTAIAELLRREGPKNIPEIAEALGIHPAEAMLYVMGMWRYGKVEALPKGRRERYFQYGLREEG